MLYTRIEYVSNRMSDQKEANTNRSATHTVTQECARGDDTEKG